MTMEQIKEVRAPNTVADVMLLLCTHYFPAEVFPCACGHLQIQEECMADDVPIPPEAVAWVTTECYEYFESGGKQLPQILPGFEGAEIHSHYELNQKRQEHQGMDDMLEMLSSAIFKTTGDEQFKVEEKPKADEVEWGQMKRERYEPQYKYKVSHLGDVGSSSEVRGWPGQRERGGAAHVVDGVLSIHRTPGRRAARSADCTCAKKACVPRCLAILFPAPL